MTDPPQQNDVPEDLLQRLQRCTSDELAAISEYAGYLATTEDQDGSETNEGGQRKSDENENPPALPRDVAPSRATLTTKTIDGNNYYYWQWREGDQVKSEYIGPTHRY